LVEECLQLDTRARQSHRCSPAQCGVVRRSLATLPHTHTHTHTDTDTDTVKEYTTSHEAVAWAAYLPYLGLEPVKYCQRIFTSMVESVS